MMNDTSVIRPQDVFEAHRYIKYHYSLEETLELIQLFVSRGWTIEDIINDLRDCQ